MEEILLKTILKKEKLFVPLIFTQKQMNILRKYDTQIQLSNAEKKALYTSIKRKMDACHSICLEQKEVAWCIYGAEAILPERLQEAKAILMKYTQKYEKVFISGSFLFSKKYHDLDIFIIRKRGYKEEVEGIRHIIFLPERRLSDPIFQSAALISVSNFMIPFAIKKKKPKLSEVMSMYHESVIEYMKKESKPEATRRLLFEYHLFCNNKLLNGKELKFLSTTISIDEINQIIKLFCKKIFSKSYLYVNLHQYIKTLNVSIQNISLNNHLIMFRNTYEELIYGKQRSKTIIA